MAHQSKSEARVAKVKQAHSTIETHVKELAEQMERGKSDQLLTYLNCCSQFHQYSFRNIMLAFSQREDLTQLAGMRQWNKLGRHVRKGEKGIMILAPMSVPDKRAAADDPDARIMLFRPVYVFDVSQTEGQDLPELVHTAGDVSAILPALEKAVAAANITLEYADLSIIDGADGHSYGGRIAVEVELDEPDRFRTLGHEFAHEKLHRAGPRDEKKVRETEADAVAYVLCRHYGVACDASDYLLLYDATPKLLLERLETIRSAANEIIDEISSHLPNAEDSETDGGVDHANHSAAQV